jgi:Putative MetA-pathway of phenol degradation
MSRRLIFVTFLVFSAVALPASAQVGKSASQPYEESSAGRAMKRITFGAIDCSDPPACTSDAFTTSGIFVNGTYSNTRANYGGNTSQADVANSLLQLILSQSQTFPNVSTASGFTFTIGSSDAPELESPLYGPLFGERALTNGRGQLSVTFNAQRLRFQKLNGSLIGNTDSGLLWGDLGYDSTGNLGYTGICRMDINTTVYFAAANYGLRDKLDLSVSVPIVHTSVEGSNEFIDYSFEGKVLDDVKDGFDPQGRYFVEGSSTGLGDIGVGAKYAFIREADKGAALSVYAKLPTGSLEDMTGTGETSVGGNFIASFERSGWSPHINVGGLVATGDVFNELNYNLGLSYRAVQDRLTLVGEFVGRRLFEVSQFRAERDLGFLTSPVTGEQFLVRDFEAVQEAVDSMFVALGAKFRLKGQLLATVFTVLPTTVSGLQVTRPTFNFGLNWAR